MNAVESIVGIYKNRCGLRFDKDAAESLGLDGKTFSNYMKGRRRLPDIAIAKMADMAHIDAMQIIAAVNVTYEKTPEEERPFWLEKLKSAGGQMLLLVATTTQTKARQVRAIFFPRQGFALHPTA